MALTAVPARSLAIFTRQLSVMIDAGLPLTQCLDILARQEPQPRLAMVIRRIRIDVLAGTSLTQALGRHGGVFDALYVNLVSAGEAGGVLGIVLERLAVHLEKAVRLQGQVRAALVYPASIVVFAVAVVAVILWLVIPTFATLLGGLGADLPWPTKLVVGASAVTTAWLPHLTAGLAAAAYAARRWYATSAGRAAVDRGMLALPVVGALVRKVAVARFCRTLSTLLASGVPILDGLDITARTAGNAVVEGAVQAARGRVARGEPLAGPLGQTGVFPGMVVQMIAVGETTGALDGMLAKIADFYEDEVDTAVTGLLKLLEPALVGVLGLVVGGIVLSMYLPIFELIAELAG